MSKILLGQSAIELNIEMPEYRLRLPQVTDISEEEEIQIEVELLDEGPVELEVTLYPLRIARPEFFPCTRGRAVIAGKGAHVVDIPFGQFDFRQMVRAFLNYLDAVAVRIADYGDGMEEKDGREKSKGRGDKRGKDWRVLLKGIRADKIGNLEVLCGRTSGVAGAGGSVRYLLRLCNKAAQERFVNISRSLYGKECLPADYGRCVRLAGNETKEYEIQIHMTEDIPPGGLERSEFLFVPDGEAAQGKRLVLSTLKERPHPYLVLRKEQWRERKERILADGALRQVFAREYEQPADGWKVPEVSESGEYVYPSYSQNDLFRAAVAWKLTGKEAFLQKAAAFLRGLLDKEHGYRKTETSYFTFIEKKAEYARGDFKVHRAQSAGWVQEAEFFSRVAMAYDLLYGCFTQEEHQEMEACLRDYMRFAGWRLTDGDGNNFQVAEAGAGLLCAMALQDQEMIDRFLHGWNGYLDLLSAVFLDDGMYFEGATNYVRLAGELFFDIVNAAENFGIALKDVRVSASFDRNILHAPWAMREAWAEDGKPFLGMSFRRFEKFTKTDRGLKDYFDCTAKLLTGQGIMFSMNDSNEQDFIGLFRKAYYLYGDLLYREIAALEGEPEVLFVRGEERERIGESVLLEGAGLGILRDGESQAVLKFGGHGGYHGHFDRLSLASFLKDGQTFHNNEYAWFGYNSFLFKMWVQTSMAHNMVVVDGRMQKPSACSCIYYEENELFRAVGAQTEARWIDPPYGGQTPYPFEFPEEKCAMEGRHILPPGQKREQGEIGEESEAVWMRRLLILFHGYCIIWDYLEGKEAHRFDCLYHPMGRFDNEGKIDFRYAGRFSDDPFGAGQFILNCYTAWVENGGCPGDSLCLGFHGAKPRVNGNDRIDFMPEAAVWRAYPLSGEVVIGKYPEKGDTFTEENCKNTMGYLSEPLKKTVSFVSYGRSAGFITLLEAGKATGRIKKVLCREYGRIIIEEEDGGRWDVSVKGMKQEKAGLSVEIREA